MTEYVEVFLGDINAAKIVKDGASDYLSQVCGELISNRKFLVQLIVKCLNQDPKIKACYATGVGAAIPGDLCDEAKGLCKGWIT